MWYGLPNAAILWLLLSPLELGGSFSINPLISPKDLFEVTQVTQGGSRTQLALALLDLLAAVTLEEKMATQVRNTGVCSLIPLLCGEEDLGGLLTFATLYQREIVWAAGRTLPSAENTSRTITSFSAHFPWNRPCPRKPS